jgi:hypothetical protein
MVCQYVCTTEGFFEPTEAFSYTGPPKCHPFGVVHPLPGFVAVYRPKSLLSLPLSFSVGGGGYDTFYGTFSASGRSYQAGGIAHPLLSLFVAL